MSQIDRVKYMAEMKALLSFMDAEERLTVMRRYERRFDAAGQAGEGALIKELGSPVRQVLMVEREYREREEAGLPGVASDEEYAEEAAAAAEEPAVEEIAAEEAADKEAELQAEVAMMMEQLLSEEAQEEFLPEAVQEPEPEAEEYWEEDEEALEETPAEEAPSTGRVVGAVALTPVMIVVALAGVALTALLTALGVVPGLGLGAAAVYLALYALNAMSFLPDILLVCGVAIVSLALCILFLWLGIWLLVEGISLTVRTISGVYGKVLRKGGAVNE